MANLTSKLAIGGSIAIVLLMLFSAIPVAAETSENANEKWEPLTELQEGKSKTSVTGLYVWDETNCVLTLKSGLHTQGFDVETSSGKTLQVIVEGKVVLQGWIQLRPYKDVIITGGGEIVKESIGYIIMMPSTAGIGEDYAIIDGVSLDLSGYNYILTFFLQTKIINCPSVKLSSSEVTVSCSAGLEIKNSNLYLESEGYFLIDNNGGGCIFMDGMPVSEDELVYLDSEGYEMDTFVSGETSAICSYSEGISMKMESYVPPAKDVTPWAIGIFVVLLAIVVIGAYGFSKK